jgi:hypothetical protein
VRRAASISASVTIMAFFPILVGVTMLKSR